MLTETSNNSGTFSAAPFSFEHPASKNKTQAKRKMAFLIYSTSPLFTCSKNCMYLFIIAMAGVLFVTIL
jgi:hypothetical protein